MPLQDTEALDVETMTAAESLPDAATVAGRTHRLINGGTVAAVWSVPAGLGYQVQGVNLATITIPPGQAVMVQAQAGRWVVAPSQAGRRIFAGSGVANASGDVVFTFTPPFNSIPAVAHAIGLAGITADAVEGRITALSAGSCTVNVRRAPSVVILGISVLQVPIPDAGAQVNIIAIEAGQGV